jgi:hypothetical protein
VIPKLIPKQERKGKEREGTGIQEFTVAFTLIVELRAPAMK